jgi:transcriptional regulator with XRE-family HTH domain
VNWTAQEIRQLRCRLGWSQAELARQMKTELAQISAWELGASPLGDQYRSRFAQFFHQAEMNAERIQRRPIAEIIMRDRGLSQIHDFDVIDSITVQKVESK